MLAGFSTVLFLTNVEAIILGAAFVFRLVGRGAPMLFLISSGSRSNVFTDPDIEKHSA